MAPRLEITARRFGVRRQGHSASPPAQHVREQASHRGLILHHQHRQGLQIAVQCGRRRPGGSGSARPPWKIHLEECAPRRLGLRQRQAATVGGQDLPRRSQAHTPSAVTAAGEPGGKDVFAIRRRHPGAVVRHPQA